jgi:hypothetical protein
MTGYLCSPRLYEYRGWFFEYSASIGPWPLHRDGEPRKRAGRRFWQVVRAFDAEPERERYRVGGGCMRV